MKRTENGMLKSIMGPEWGRMAAVALGVLALGLPSCSGERGQQGPAGNPGVDGTDGEDGVFMVQEHCSACHSPSNEAAVETAHLEKEYSHPSADVTYTGEITAASINGSGNAEITFQIKDNHGDFVRVGMFEHDGPLSSRDIRFYVAKLEQGSQATQFDWKRVAYERGNEAQSFVANGDGTYTYTSSVDISAGFTDATYPARDAAYDANATYRAGIAFGGHGGPASSPTFDFRPADDETDPTVIDTRNIVSTSTCVKCHGNDFHGHGGDRKTLENCVLCHNPTTLLDDLDNNELGGEKDSAAMAVLVHNIHNGTNDYWIYRTRAGGNWYNWGANPVPADHERSTHAMTFPQPSYECQACHEADTTTMSDGTNWKTNPSIVACGDSCHTDVDFTQAHMGGVKTDADCAGCHDGDGIAAKHSKTNTDIVSAADLALDTPEYTVEVKLLDASDAEIAATTNVAGTSPKVRVVISDSSGPIDHTTVSDFGHANLFVYGPRSQMKPVLTTAAAAGGGGYYAANDLKEDPKATITAGSIVYQLDSANGLTPGTYMAYVDLVKNKGDETAGFQAPSTGLAHFQVGTAGEERVAGNCMACHGMTVFHTGKMNSHRHDTVFDTDRCGACHDYVKGNDTTTNYEWFGAVPLSKRVHAVHAAATLIDPDYTIGHAPPEGHVWSHIAYPASLNDCAGACHHPDNSTTAWKEKPAQLPCMGCHDQPAVAAHTYLMGGDAAPAR